MTKNEFLAAVAGHLRGLPQTDIDKSLEFYSEMIDDRIDDGSDEADAVAAMGSPEEAARSTMMDMPLPKIVKAQTSKARKPRAWEIVLLVLGSPIWLSLLAAALIVLLAIYIVIWTVAISFWAVDISFVAGSLGGIFTSGFLAGNGNVLVAVLLLGTAVLLAGLSVFVFFGCKLLTKAIIKLSLLVWRGVKSIFIRKGEKT